MVNDEHVYEEDFKFDKKIDWKPHDSQGKEPALEYQKPSPATMSMELMFDTTVDKSDVRTAWVNKLLALTNPSVKPTTGEAGKHDKGRPPTVTFVWGQFQMLGVIESLNVSYLMFSSEGTPLRAKVQVKMKEWVINEYKDGTGGQAYGSSPVQLITVNPGDTASSIAAEYGSSWRAVADANGWDNPLEDVKAGMKALIKRELKAALPGGSAALPEPVWKKLGMSD